MNLTDKERVQTEFMQATKNSLRFEETVCQISNISEVRAIDLSTEKRLPRYLYLLPVFGALLLLAQELIAISLGLACIGGFALLFFYHQRTKVNQKYGVFIGLNSGRNWVLTSRQYEFATSVVSRVEALMNESVGSFEVNFNSMSIHEGDHFEGISGAVNIATHGSKVSAGG
ncbi:MAG: DUF6232 family protein [Pseudomonadota bacterium]